MEKKRLQEVASLIVDLESDIYFHNGNRRRQREELAELDCLIEEIQDHADLADDLTVQRFLSQLQYKAYQCRFQLLKRAAARS